MCFEAVAFCVVPCSVGVIFVYRNSKNVKRMTWSSTPYTLWKPPSLPMISPLRMCKSRLLARIPLLRYVCSFVDFVELRVTRMAIFVSCYFLCQRFVPISAPYCREVTTRFWDIPLMLSEQISGALISRWVGIDGEGWRGVGNLAALLICMKSMKRGFFFRSMSMKWMSR